MVTLEDEVLTKIKKLFALIWLRLLIALSSVVDSCSLCLVVMEKTLCWWLVVGGTSGECICTTTPFSRVAMNGKTIMKCVLFQSADLRVVSGVKMLVTKNSKKWFMICDNNGLFASKYK